MKNTIPKGIIVSCQALKDEPLYGGNTIPKMAAAAKEGGAVAIRANTVRDINAIWRHLKGSLPIIGLIKKNYSDSEVYITPTIKEAKALIASKCDVIAVDATQRRRPNGLTLKELVDYLRAHTVKPIMADVADYEDVVAAEKLGFDYISTTLRSYTAETKGIAIPDMEFCTMVKDAVQTAVPVAEGALHTYEELSYVLNTGND
ncbi:MAG: N-acetylmannosamine-6-phosphate 2-epimerase, partial [Clostridia bacterium]|nr:N-acetylmannosamine-6-phosphate 2-epimerase [Clostridia bacterium]